MLQAQFSIERKLPWPANCVLYIVSNYLPSSNLKRARQTERFTAWPPALHKCQIRNMHIIHLLASYQWLHAGLVFHESTRCFGDWWAAGNVTDGCITYMALHCVNELYGALVCCSCHTPSGFFLWTDVQNRHSFKFTLLPVSAPEGTIHYGCH